jgi:hypothetical protein
MTAVWMSVAIVCAAPFLILAWMRADEWLADREARRTPQPAPEPPNPLLTHPSLRTHQTVARIRDRIAANEAARLDDEWATVAKEWTR